MILELRRRQVPQYRIFQGHTNLDIVWALIGMQSEIGTLAVVCEPPPGAFAVDTWVWRFLSDFSVDMSRSTRDLRCRMMKAVNESTRTFTATT